MRKLKQIAVMHTSLDQLGKTIQEQHNDFVTQHLHINTYSNTSDEGNTRRLSSRILSLSKRSGA